MISASHNPFGDNGIKLFGLDGFKLLDAQEQEREFLLEQENDELLRPSGVGVGQVSEYTAGGQPTIIWRLE